MCYLSLTCIDISGIYEKCYRGISAMVDRDSSTFL